MSYRPLFPVLTSFALGISLAHVWQPAANALLLASLGYLLAWIWARHRLPLQWPLRQASLCLLFCLSFAAAGAWRYAVSQQPPALSLQDGKTLCRLRGLVTETPLPASWFVKPVAAHAQWLCYRNWFVVRLSAICSQSPETPASGHVKVVVLDDWSGLLCRGDEVELLGWLDYFAPPANPGEWDQRFHWHTQGVDYRFSVMHSHNIRVIARDRGCPLLNWFSRLRMRCVEKLRLVVGADTGNFLAALTLGTRRLLPDDKLEAFSVTGLIHLLAISGMNISLVAMFAYAILQYAGCRPTVKYLLVVALCLTYTLLTELQTSVLRAAIMAAVCFMAPMLGRKCDGLNALAAAALAILWWSPGELMLPGFQLSFAACLGILLWQQQASPAPDASWNAAMPGWQGQDAAGNRPWRLAIAHRLASYLGQSLTISLVAWLATAPLVASHFFLCPLLAPLATVVLIPLVTLLFAGTLLLLFSPAGIGYAADLLANSLQLGSLAMERVAATVAALPVNVTVLPPLAVVVAAFYLLLPLAMAGECLWRRLFLLTAATAAVLASGLMRGWSGGECGVSVLHVGHGCAIYVKLPGGRHFLYDCGAAVDGSGARVVWPFLRVRGVRRLDGIILSHYDADHYNGFLDIATRMPVKRLYVNRVFSERGEELLRMARRLCVEVSIVQDGEVPAGAEELVFRHPGERLEQTEFYSDNEHSLLLQLSLYGSKMLFTADLGRQSLGLLLEQDLPPLDWLQIPHHGSCLAGTAELLERCRPRQAFVCRKHSASLPVAETLSLYARYGVPVWSTCHSGCLDIFWQKGKPELFIIRACLFGRNDL